jgi:uncharacterized RDD family membrane protein YckC
VIWEIWVGVFQIADYMISKFLLSDQIHLRPDGPCGRTKCDMETNSFTQSSAEAQCRECGGTFSLDNMIRHGNAYVCANCKPIFMQKLSEGVAFNTGTVYAGFWLRFAAVFLDTLLVGVVNIFVQQLILLTTQRLDRGGLTSILPILIGYAISILLGIGYEVFLFGKYGATVGKMACRIKVVTADGDPISYGRALARHFAKWLSGLTLLIGYIIAAFDEQKRSLHDHICNTRVVVQ